MQVAERLFLLRGRLEEFNLGELLQMFALSEKTGTISVSYGACKSRLFVEAGRVVGWGLDDFDPHAAILACRFLPPDTEAAIRSIVPDPGAPGLAFVIGNVVEPERWAIFVQRLLEQDTYGILDRDEGEFEIKVDRLPTVPLHLDLSVQQLILDASRWEADFSELAQDGYSAESKWKRVDRDQIDSAAEMSHREWLVYSALAKACSIGTVAAELCIPDIETAETVKALHGRDLVVPITDE